MNTEEGVHNLPDGSELYTKTWKTSGSPRAILAFIHGFSDHCNAYGELFPTLASAGIEVRSFDQRLNPLQCKGQTETNTKNQRLGPQRQATPRPGEYRPNKPSPRRHALFPPDPAITERLRTLFLMGHSMGGGQTLNYIFHPDSPYNKDKTSRPGFAGVLLYSPLIALDPSTRPSRLLVAAGRIVAKLIPHMQKYTPLEATLLSRDEAVCRDFVADTLCHDMGTFEGLAGMLDRGIWLEGMFGGSAGGWVESELPFWFGHGTGDRITAFSATKVFVEGLKAKGGDVQFCAYENAYHKLHAELPETTEKFFADVKTWVLERVPGMEGEVEPRVKL
ncbi:hypothetical protein N7535_006964 [Penicillium sp. DV-2018c]|nr:hypothetical protein N7535_006964 [Penicillium sp. DV-2018c]